VRTANTVISIAAVIFFSCWYAFASSDDYMKGYAEAVLKKQFGIIPVSVNVEDGVITVILEDTADPLKEQITEELYRIDGTRAVMLTGPAPSETGTALHPEAIPSARKDGREHSGTGGSFFEKEHLFDPLIADPRWPHFSIAYQFYINDDELRNAAATSFGETLPFYSDAAPFGGNWQLGLQAAVFALFDLDAASHDLINADYWVGVPLSYRKNDFSAMTRLYHQSSHLGDEFLLRSRVNRVNLSYEAVDIKASYDFTRSFRGYAGSGFLIRKEPEDLKRWSLQYGFEFRSSRAYLNNTVKPLAGADFKSREENDWDIDMSLRAGVQLESNRMFWNRLNLMLEYFYGFSPNGQFYDRRIKFLSLGMHFYF